MAAMGVLLLSALLQSPIPLEPGTWWEYLESYTEYLGGVDSTTDEVTRFEVRGRRERPFLHQHGGADPSPGPVEIGEGWIRLGPWTGEDALPLPLEPGRSGPPSAPGTSGFTVEGQEEVTVPAGTFTALRCALRTRSFASVLWIAPGVGVVRETQGPPGRRPEIERVLLRWGGPAETPSPGPVGPGGSVNRSGRRDLHFLILEVGPPQKHRSGSNHGRTYSPTFRPPERGEATASGDTAALAG